MTVEHCERVREDLPALHYGDLEGAEKVEIERHLAECAPCRAALEAVRETAAGLDRIPLPVPTDSDWVRLDARIEARVAPLRAARFARSYGRFPTFARIAAAALVGTLAVLSAGLYSRTRDQASEIASLRKDVADTKWDSGKITDFVGLALKSKVDDDPSLRRKLEVAKLVNEPVALLYQQSRMAGSEQEIRERIADLLASYPKDRLADQAFVALQKMGVPTPRPLEEAVLQPVSLFRSRPVPETATLEATWREDIALKRLAAASAKDPKVAAFALFRSGEQAEDALRDTALAAELYREAVKRLPVGEIAKAAEMRLARLERK